jgi:hypothetical protein
VAFPIVHLGRFIQEEACKCINSTFFYSEDLHAVLLHQQSCVGRVSNACSSFDKTDLMGVQERLKHDHTMFSQGPNYSFLESEVNMYRQYFPPRMTSGPT